jgi:hypothetical protein
MNKTTNLLKVALGAILLYMGVDSVSQCAAFFIFPVAEGQSPVLGIISFIFPSLGIVFGLWVLSGNRFGAIGSSLFLFAYLVLINVTNFFYGPMSNIASDSSELKTHLIAASVGFQIPIILLLAVNLFLLRNQIDQSHNS